MFAGPAKEKAPDLTVGFAVAAKEGIPVIIR
jgi:hypothetical protein